MMLRVLLFAGLLSAEIAGQIIPHTVSFQTAKPVVFGDADLFRVADDAVEVSWDSARTNSYLYVPLGFTLTSADRFSFAFKLSLSEIAIGTTPGKPYTFQIAIGLINVENAFDPELFRGSGVNTAHGARNLLEWNYFPDSGFGATVAPTIATEANQIAFSGNYPVEIVPGETYRFELAFTPQDRTLRSTMRRGTEPTVILKELVVSASFASFRLNALAIANYSDAGQTAPFAGSIRAQGTVGSLEAIVYDRPRLKWEADGVDFETSTGWRYFLEKTTNMSDWESATEPIPGSGTREKLPIQMSGPMEIYRVRGEPMP